MGIKPKIQLNVMTVTLVLLLLAANAGAQSQNSSALGCSTQSKTDELVQPMSREEATRLQAAPHGAKRIGKHRLEVAWGGGKQIFEDKPPYNEPLDGIKWVYCGYDAKRGLHLILKQDQSVFTGALLDDGTGALLPGGQAVSFSSDEKYYLAYEQPDGQDGKTIKLYERTGTLVWKGYDGLLSDDEKSVVAEFQNMRWDSQNRLQADAVLDGGKTVTVTLTLSKDGKREWSPHIGK